MTTPRFACDAMMKGLARWLRACGYDATWTYGIDDDALLEHGRAEGRVVLTGDSGIMQRRCVKDGDPVTLYVPNPLPPMEQVAHVLRELRLPVRAARCMACGGEPVGVSRESVRDEAPPRTFARGQPFQRCARCGKLLWRGTHWEQIEERLRSLLGPRS